MVSPLQEQTDRMADEIMRQYRGHFLTQMDVPLDNRHVPEVLHKLIWFIESVALSHDWQLDRIVPSPGGTQLRYIMICQKCRQQRRSVKPVHAGDETLTPDYYLYQHPGQWQESFCRQRGAAEGAAPGVDDDTQNRS